jgi:uncharacterized membrane protein
MIYPLCNKRPERAPHVCGHVFPLCWRCTGVLVGAVLIDAIFLSMNPKAQVMISLSILCIPMFIDVYRQYYRKLMSTNPRRFYTGFLCGIAIMGWATLIKEGVNLWSK